MAIVLQQPDWHTTLDSVSAMYHKLLIIVGPVASGKTEKLREIKKSYNVSELNLGAELSKALMPVPVSLRPIKAEEIAEQLILNSGSNQVAIDNIEILFEPPMELNPLSFLKRLPQTKTIIVTCTGNYSNNTQRRTQKN